MEILQLGSRISHNGGREVPLLRCTCNIFLMSENLNVFRTETFHFSWQVAEVATDGVEGEALLVENILLDLHKQASQQFN